MLCSKSINKTLISPYVVQINLTVNWQLMQGVLRLEFTDARGISEPFKLKLRASTKTCVNLLLHECNGDTSKYININFFRTLEINQRPAKI